MKYNEGAINSFSFNNLNGEQAIISYFNQNPNADLDYTNINEYNVILIDAVENYVLKRIKDHSLDSISLKVLNYVYNGFIKNPEVFMKSILITENVAKQVLSTNDYKKYKKKTNELNEKAKKIYYRRMNGNVTEKEKDLLANFLIKIKNSPNVDCKKAIENYARKIIEENKPVKATNTSELTLLAYYASKEIDSEGYLVDFIRICDNQNKNNGGYHKSRFIHINKTGNYLLSIDHFIATACHETRHAQQAFESKTKKSLIGFEYAASEILRKYLTTQSYNPYTSYHNYRYSEIETDANMTGYYTASTILHRMGFKERHDKMHERYMYYDKERQLEFANKFGSDNSFHTIEKTLIEDLSKVIKRYPELIKEYPSLQDFYEENGNIKSFNKIMKEAIKSSFGNKTYYYYRTYLKYALSKDNFEKIEIEKMPEQIRERYYITLIKLFNEEDQTIKNHLEAVRDISNGKRQKITPTQIIVGTGKSNINRYLKLQQLLYDNYADIIRLEKQGMLSTSIWSSMGIRSTMHSISTIDISNDNLPMQYKEDLQKLIIDTREKYRNIIKGHNKERIKKEIAKYDEKTLSMKVPLPNGVYITLRQYIEEYISIHLDRHGYFIDDKGKQRYISEIIKEAVFKSKKDASKRKDNNNELTSMTEYINSLSGLSEEQKQLLIENLNQTSSKSKPRHIK